MIHLQDILMATGGVTLQRGVSSFTGFSFDSRRAASGELFVALVTPTGDGHEFIQEAVSAGATGVLCQHEVQLPPGITVVLVDDTLRALLAYARHILTQRELPVVAVTGSVGKTSTKEMLAAILSRRQALLWSPESYNGRIGLPIALGQLEPRHTLAVLELAADGLGEIEELAQIVRPQVGIVTAVGESHLAAFGSRQAIAREKGALLMAIPAGGVAVLNADDLAVRDMPTPSGVRRVLVGRDPAADVRIVDVRVGWDGTRVVLHEQGQTCELHTRLLGAHQAYVVGLAAAAARALGLGWDDIRAGVAACEPPPGRLTPLAGAHGSRLLDDSYNASPTAVLAALDTLDALPARRRVLVLGDMAELGPEARAYHEAIGRRSAQTVDRLVTVGDLAALAGAAARQAGLTGEQVAVCHTHEDAIAAVRADLHEGDAVLIKGSAAARLEMVARGLMAEPWLASERLARQHAAYDAAHLAMPERPAWIEVDIEAIAGNVRALKALVGEDVALMAVLKADAYGHGAVRVARTALHNGAAWLGVASLNEALTLRDAGIEAPILILGYTPPWQARIAVARGITVAVFDLQVARALSRAAQDVGRAAHAHLKVDTGMGRLGILPDEVGAFLAQALPLPGLALEGIFSHLATADEPDLAYAHWQIEQFERALAAAAEAGLSPQWVHLANSAATLRLPQSRYNLIRPGIALYGLSPSAVTPLPAELRPALAFKCQVAQVKTLPPGASVGYGRAYRVTQSTTVAVAPVGYADGFRRSPCNWGEVLVRGQRAPILGNVCMDQTMIDVTSIPGVQAGDEVVLIGAQGDDVITVEDVAARLGAINYEVVSALLARVPRVV
jgi:alanine racemase